MENQNNANDKKVKRTMEIHVSTQTRLTDIASEKGEMRNKYKGCYQPLARDILKNFCAINSYALATQGMAHGTNGLTIAKAVEALREAISIIEAELGQSGDTVANLTKAADDLAAMLSPTEDPHAIF